MGSDPTRRCTAGLATPALPTKCIIYKCAVRDGRGLLATPGLVNCHHHLYQWATRGLAQSSTLFEWLQELYPVWAYVDDGIEQAAARAGLVALARRGAFQRGGSRARRLHPAVGVQQPLALLDQGRAGSFRAQRRRAAATCGAAVASHGSSAAGASQLSSTR